MFVMMLHNLPRGIGVTGLTDTKNEVIISKWPFVLLEKVQVGALWPSQAAQTVASDQPSPRKRQPSSVWTSKSRDARATTSHREPNDKYTPVSKRRLLPELTAD